jgi:hypothetical protein
MATLTSRPPLFPHTYWTVGWESPRVVVGAFTKTISFCLYRGVNTDGAACSGSLPNEFMLQFSGLFSTYSFLEYYGRFGGKYGSILRMFGRSQSLQSFPTLKMRRVGYCATHVTGYQTTHNRTQEEHALP